MLRITKITDYGFVLLAHMAREGGERLYTAKDLSATLGLPLPTVGKVLKILTQGGILRSHQGSKGGYSLERPAGRISAAAVIEAMEGPVALTDCSTPEGCGRGGCAVGKSWRRLNDAVVAALEALTLASMAKGPD